MLLLYKETTAKYDQISLDSKDCDGFTVLTYPHKIQKNLNNKTTQVVFQWGSTEVRCVIPNKLFLAGKCVCMCWVVGWGGRRGWGVWRVEL